MTISNQTASVLINGNGVQTVFAYNFLIPYQSDGVTPAVAVYTVTDDVQTLIAPADYTITGVGDEAGGTVTYDPDGTPIPTGTALLINRALLYTQPYAFPNQGFYPQTAEQAFDSLTMQIQQLAAALGVTTTTQPQLESFAFALTDETTAIVSTGVYITFYMPYDFNVEEVQTSLTHTVATANFIQDILVNGVSILSTLATVEIGELSSLTAATQPVVSNPSIPKGAKVQLSVTQVGTTAAGAKCLILGRQA